MRRFHSSKKRTLIIIGFSWIVLFCGILLLQNRFLGLGLELSFFNVTYATYISLGLLVWVAFINRPSKSLGYLIGGVAVASCYQTSLAAYSTMEGDVNRFIWPVHTPVLVLLAFYLERYLPSPTSYLRKELPFGAGSHSRQVPSFNFVGYLINKVPKGSSDPLSQWAAILCVILAVSAFAKLIIPVCLSPADYHGQILSNVVVWWFFWICIVGLADLLVLIISIFRRSYFWAFATWIVGLTYIVDGYCSTISEGQIPTQYILYGILWLYIAYSAWTTPVRTNASLS